MPDEREERRAAAAKWLAEAAAAENQQFLGELTYLRAGRLPAAAGGDGQPVEPYQSKASAWAQADAAEANQGFQQHVANYDPNLFRRGRRRKVEYDKPVGPRPATLADAQAADAEFLRGMQHWSPN